MRLVTAAVVIFGLGAGLTACAPIVAHRGYLPDPKKTQAISAGVDTKATVQDRLGTPTQVATFDPNVWYYISSIEHQVSWHRPRTVTQSVIQVTFDADGKVKDIKRSGNEKPRELAFVDRVTPARGRELNFWEQMFGNVGRYPTQDDGQNRGGPQTPRRGGGQ